MLILENLMLFRMKGDATAAMKRATGLESVPGTRTMQSESCFCDVMRLLTHLALAFFCMGPSCRPCTDAGVYAWQKGAILAPLQAAKWKGSMRCG